MHNSSICLGLWRKAVFRPSASILIECRRQSSSDKPSSRGKLPLFLPDRAPGDSDADFDASAVHAKLCKASEKRMKGIAELKNVGAPSVSPFYLTDRPFTASIFPPYRPRWWVLFNDLGIAWSLTKASLVNAKAYSEFSMQAMADAYEQAVLVILRKIVEGKGNELVERKLMTEEAFKAIEPTLLKLDKNQMKLLDISSADFTQRVPLLTKVNLRQSTDGSAYLSFFFFDIALYASDKLELTGWGKNAKLIVKRDYPFDLPKQIYINLEFERQIAPVMSDFIVSKFNFIVVP